VQALHICAAPSAAVSRVSGHTGPAARKRGQSRAYHGPHRLSDRYPRLFLKTNDVLSFRVLVTP
jgi:hypothetical protein